MTTIAIFASGSGTNAENIVKIFHAGSQIRCRLVLTNRTDSGVIERMRPYGVEVRYIPLNEWINNPSEIAEMLRNEGIDLIVLAGFMVKIAPEIIEAFPQRVINIHPSLLPAYGGKGMYGHHVHEAVIAAGEKKSGVTVHYVNEELDEGAIVMQEEIEICEGETPESLEAKIHEIEYRLYPRALATVVRNLEDSKEDKPFQPSATQINRSDSEEMEREWAEVLEIPIYSSESKKASVSPPYQPVSMESKQAESTLPTDPMPPTYLLWSVLMTICCCSIPGIIAIIFSAKVSSKYYDGDIEGARKMSHMAEIWIIVSFVLGVLSATLYMPLSIVKQLLVQ